MEVVSTQTTVAPATSYTSSPMQQGIQYQGSQGVQGIQQGYTSSPLLQQQFVPNQQQFSPSLQSVPIGYSPTTVKNPAFMGSPVLGNTNQVNTNNLVAQQSSFGRFVNAETPKAHKVKAESPAKLQKNANKAEKRRLKNDRKLAGEEKKAILRGQKLEEKLRNEDYLMRNSRVEKLQLWYQRSQLRSLALSRELQLLNAHTEKMRGILNERSIQGQNQTFQGQNQPFQAQTQTFQGQNQPFQGQNQPFQGQNQSFQGQNQSYQSTPLANTYQTTVTTTTYPAV